MAYEMFEKKKTTRNTSKFLTITKQGTIRFSKKCYEAYMKEYDTIKFLFNAETNCIGLKLYTENDDNAYKIRKAKIKNSFAYSVSAAAFLKFYGVDFSETKRYRPIWIEKKEMIKINLNKEI